MDLLFRNSRYFISCATVSLAVGCATTQSSRHWVAHPEIEIATESIIPHKIPEKAGTHRVQAGETLYRISKNYNVTLESLTKENGLGKSTAISVGQLLKIPGQVKPPPLTAKREGRRVEAPAVVSSSVSTSVASPDVVPSSGHLSWPVRGVLYARFGKKGTEPHDGIDLAAPSGTPIQTAAPGTVLYAGEQRGYGLIAIIEHENSTVTVYAHNRDLRVQSGQKVRSGQVIATVGESGRTSGPHLHFEVRMNGRPVDPLLHLSPLTSDRVGRRAVPQ